MTKGAIECEQTTHSARLVLLQTPAGPSSHITPQGTPENAALRSEAVSSIDSS